jgi:quinol monooxygenase YgiN
LDEEKLNIMSMYGLYGKLKTKPGKGSELAAILLEAAQLMNQAKGCHLYIVLKEVGEEDSIGVTEVWENKEDHDNSLNMPACRELIAKAIPLLDSPPKKGVEFEVLGGKGL